MTRIVFALSLALTASGPAFADGTARFTSPTPEGVKTMEMAWLDPDTMRISPGTPETYMLVRDGKLYSVTSAGGMGVQVFDLGALGEMAGSMSGGAAGAMGGQMNDQSMAHLTPEMADEVIALEATGRSEEIAGIQGELYEMSWIDDEGARHTDQMVLTDDPLAIEMGEAFSAMAAAASGEVDPRHQAVAERGLGILRYGEAFIIESLTDEAPPAAAFELPAEPLDLGNMMGGYDPGR